MKIPVAKSSHSFPPLSDQIAFSVKISTLFAKNLRVQKITTLFRFIELFLLLVLISKIFIQFAFSVKSSGGYLRRISSKLFNSGFVFLIGNAIVITLFLKSRWFSGKHNSTGNQSGSDFCAEYVEKSVSEYQIQRTEDPVTFDIDQNCAERKISRSQSENLNRGGEKQSKQLRRSATEKFPEIPPAVTPYAEEEMSSDEFRRRVEAFIARRQKFLREEDFPAIAGY